MADKTRSLSPITSFYSDLQQFLNEDQFEHIAPLINSALDANAIQDDAIAQQQQEYLNNEYFMDVDEPTIEGASLFDPKRLEEIDRDAAFALQLQNDEYSRNSLTPRRPTEQEPNTKSFLSIIMDSSDSLVLSDADYAAHLQAEEDQKPARNRFRPPFPRQRREPYINIDQTRRPSAPEIISFPIPIRPVQQRPSSSGNGQNAFQMFEHRSQPNAGPRRAANHRMPNIANNNADFGPDDYESLLQLDNAIKKKPLTKGQINEFPTEKFHRVPNRSDENDKCSICMDDYEQNQTLRRLPCMHLYHKDCIDQWLKRDNLCPVCRIAVTK